jgi:hypothetical protein
MDNILTTLKLVIFEERVRLTNLLNEEATVARYDGIFTGRMSPAGVLS